MTNLLSCFEFCSASVDSKRWSTGSEFGGATKRSGSKSSPKIHSDGVIRLLFYTYVITYLFSVSHCPAPLPWKRRRFGLLRKSCRPSKKGVRVYLLLNHSVR